MAITLTPACAQILTDEEGRAEFRMRIPGEFSSLTFEEGVQGRFLKTAEVWLGENDAVDGDRIYNVRMEDDAGILAQIDIPDSDGVKMSTLFPDYPVIQRYEDTSISDPALPGSFIKPGTVKRISPIDGSPVFVPAGFSIAADFQSGAESAKAGRRVFTNFDWGNPN